MRIATWHRAAVLALVVVVAAIVLCWKTTHDPAIAFLPSDGRAEWIVFPTAVDSALHNVVSLDASFRHELNLPGGSHSARLTLRGARRIELRINGELVEVPKIANWKQAVEVDVGSFLRDGRNEVEARVFNDAAPPAVWLLLQVDHLTLRSDESWSASITGSSWRGAALARIPRFPRAGNPIFGAETTTDGVRAVGPWWLAWIALGVAVCLLFGKIIHLPPRWRNGLTVALPVGLWLLLFWHNSRWLTFYAGFDSHAHVDYIQYLRERHALPRPSDGFEMYQPPLFYLLSSTLLAFTGLEVNAPGAVLLLRDFTMLIGIAQFIFVFLAVRLLLQGEAVQHTVALAFAAFLPMQLCLSHYLTNETLAALCASAAIYCTLRLLRARHWSGWLAAVVGILVGAATLTKATGLLLLPAVGIALLMDRTTWAVRLRNLVLVVGLCFTVSGWHYLKIWREFSTPLLGNWDAATGFAWWQDPGYHTLFDYIRFGRSLWQPFFGALNGFPDGIYSTMWGDGLCAGVAEILFRPPWNYNAMAAGYLIALVPAILVVLGLAIAVVRLVRSPSAELAMLVALFFTTVLAIVWMTLRVPSYAQIKAFYGLSALVPLSFFVALGFAMTMRIRALALPVGVLLFLWTTNSYVSTWIPAGGSRHMYLGLWHSIEGRTDAAQTELQIAARTSVNDPIPLTALSTTLYQAGKRNEALAPAEAAVRIAPGDGAAHLQLGKVLGSRNETERALTELRRAVELSPENISAYKFLSFLLLQTNAGQAIDAASDGLAVSPFSADLHYNLAAALRQREDYVAATTQLAYAQILRPDMQQTVSEMRQALAKAAQSRNALQDLAKSAPDCSILLANLAWLLATESDPSVRDGALAERLAERGCAVTNDDDPECLASLSAAQAERGRFRDAIATAEKALALARTRNATQLVSRLETAAAAFRNGEPYREGAAR